MANLLKDLSTLTTIPYYAFESLKKKSIESICYDVEEQLALGEEVTSIDIGIGVLSILVDTDEIKYKFIPVRSLENALKETVITGESPLEKSIEQALKDKVMSVYKELF